MSNAVSRGKRRWWLLALALGLLVPGLAQAQTRRDRDESLGDRVRRQNEIARQKLEEDVTAALDDAAKIGARDPARAVVRLKKIQDRLQDDDVLTEARRTALLQRVQGRLKFYAAKAEEATRERAAREDFRDRARRARTDDERARRDQYDQANKTIRSTRDALNEQKRINQEKANGARGLLTDLDRASLPPRGDYTFPKDWRQRIKNRKVGPQLTKKEAALLKMLNSVISVDFKEQKFQDVISYLEERTGQTILLDKEALREKDIDYETPITFKARKIAFRTLLKKILQDVGLTYIIKDEMIQVTTLEKARKSMVTRAYPVGDLVTANVDPRLPPALRQLAIMQNAKELIALIKSQVEPETWTNPDAETGGAGSIGFDFSTLSLVVKQTAEMHYVLKGSLFGP